MSDSMIRDISLSDNGEQRIRWVAKFMPALNALREEFIKDQTFKAKPSSCPSIWKQKQLTWPLR